MYNELAVTLKKEDYVEYLMICCGMGRSEAENYIKMWDWEEN